MSLILIVELLVCSYLMYYLFLKPYYYWKWKNIPHVKPRPIVGNIGEFVFQTRPLVRCLEDVYNEHPDARYVGFHKFLQPVLLIRDPELIKTITVKDWHTFPHHSLVVSEDVDPLWGYSVVAMKGSEQWRQMRTIMSYAFTSSRLKNMFILMKNCSRQFIQHLENEKVSVISVDMKEVSSKYTNDVIGTTAFGLNCNSFAQPKNDFYKMGKAATTFKGFHALKFFLNGLSPYLMAVFKIQIYSKRVRNYFFGVITDNLRERVKYNIIRNDMLDLMLEAKINGVVGIQEKNHIPKEEYKSPNSLVTNRLIINDEMIVAQALIFFIGGFDSASTVISFTVYELACNLEVQARLRSEVDLAYDSCNGDITYETLTNLKYLDMVISESLRKWPPIVVSDRAVVKQYTIDSQTDGEPPLTIDTDVSCVIPIFSIHRDPKYHPNPNKFDPERFSEDNKIKPYTYLPFGSGQRSCIGARYAFLEIKLILAEIVHNFEIVPLAQTDISMSLSAHEFLLRPKSGIILGLRRRQ